jgi:hypothetical protein
MSRRRSPFAALVALATSSALLLGGCSSDEQKAEDTIEQAAEDAGESVDVDIDGDDITIENSDGTVSMGCNLPAGFPVDDIPLVDGDVMLGMGAEGEGFQVTIAYDGAPDEAMQEAVDLLEGAGFEVDESGDFGGMQTATLTSDAYTVYVSATDAEGQTALIYAVEVA